MSESGGPEVLFSTGVAQRGSMIALTRSVLVALLAFAVAVPILASSKDWLLYVATSAPLTLFLFIALDKFMPDRTEVRTDRLRSSASWRKSEVPFEKILSIRLLTPAETRFLIFGLFPGATRKVIKVSRSGLLTGRMPTLLAPEDPGAFLRVANEALAAWRQTHPLAR